MSPLSLITAVRILSGTRDLLSRKRGRGKQSSAVMGVRCQEVELRRALPPSAGS